MKETQYLDKVSQLPTINDALDDLHGSGFFEQISYLE